MMIVLYMDVVCGLPDVVFVENLYVGVNANMVKPLLLGKPVRSLDLFLGRCYN